MKTCKSILIPLALSVGSAFGGVVFEVETTDHQQSPPAVEKQEIKVQGQRLTVPTPATDEQAGGRMIFRGDRGPKGEMVVVDHGRKGYFTMDEAAIEDMTKQVSGVMSQMQEVLKNLPEEQRKAAEAMMKKRGGGAFGGMAAQGPKPVIEVKATGQNSVVNGYACTTYHVFRDGTKIREMCSTAWANFEGGDEVSGVFARMGEFAKGIMEAFSQLPGGDQNPNPYAEMNFETGFPVYTKSFDEDGEVSDEWQLKSSRLETIAEAEFEPPAGYKRLQMGGL